MSKNLVERARKARTFLGESLHFGLVAELADCVEKLEVKNDKLLQDVKLLRDAMEVAWQDGYCFCGAEGLSDAQKQFQAVFAATEQNP